MKWWEYPLATAPATAPFYWGNKATGGKAGHWLGRGLGLESVRPDYREASQRYRQMMDMQDLEAKRSLAMQDWEAAQKRAFGDISSNVARQWGQTGATTLGIESSIPGQQATNLASRWMQETGAPAFRGIESAYLGEQGQRRQAALDALYYEREKAQATAKGKSGFLLNPLAKIAGAGLGFALGGPMGAGLGSQVGGMFGGGGESEIPNPYLVNSPWNRYARGRLDQVYDSMNQPQGQWIPEYWTP